MIGSQVYMYILMYITYLLHGLSTYVVIILLYYYTTYVCVYMLERLYSSISYVRPTFIN